jgi:glycosyltransferase involved in cell wall biosynthesis
MKKLKINEMEKIVVHVVERIDDRYGGPAKSIPYTAHISSNMSLKHIIISGCYEMSENNSACNSLGIDYYKYKILGPNKLAFSPRAFSQIFYLISRREDTIIHLHNSWNAFPFFIWLLSFFYNFKIIISSRGAFFDWSLLQGKYRKKLAWIIFQKNLLKKSDVVHVTSRDEENALKSLGIFGNIKMIPNGVPLKNKVNSEIKRSISYQLGVIKILFVSRIHPKKGLEILLRALMSPKISYKIELNIAGDFVSKSYESKIKNIIDGFNDNISVNLLGHVDDKITSELYINSDIFILPSHTENFGIVIAEALSHGLPVITTIHTPWSEIEKFSAGYIIECNSDQLIVALNKFYNTDQTKRLEMSNQAKVLIKKYEWSALKKSYLDMYESLKNYI